MFTKQISKYICIPEIAQIWIQMIFEGHLILIFEYSYLSMIEEIFYKGSLMLPLNKIHTGYLVRHELYLNILSLKTR